MKAILICALVLLASCRKHEPPAPTAQQSAQLNEADAMLNNFDSEDRNSSH